MGLSFNLGRLSPSLFTDSSLNVGIGAAPSGSYKLEVTGTAKVSGATYLASSGAANVGIGTTTANAALDIAVDAAVLNYPRIYDSRTQAIDRGGKLSLGGYSDSLTTITSFGQIVGAKTNATSGNTSGYLSFLTNSGSGLVESLRLASTGVATFSGFGSNSFSSGGTGYNKLTIRNTTAGVANGSQLSIGTDADADQFYVQSFATTFTTSGMNIAGGAVVNGEGPGGLSLAATQSNIGFYTNGASSGNLRMFINTSGNVGIGTSSPAYTLDVLSTNQYTARFNSSAAQGGFVAWANSGTAYGYAGNAYHIVVGGAVGDFAMTATANMVFGTGGSLTERMRITSAGNVGVGISGVYSDVRLMTRGVDATASNYAFRAETSAAGNIMYLRNDGLIVSGTLANSPTNYTTGSAANMYVSGGGELQRSTSSLKYKTDVKDYDKGLTEVLQMRPVYYKGKNDGDTQFAGLIAEEIHELGLTEFVQYAEDGTPDALAYANMVALLVKAIQELNERLNKAGL